MEQGEGGAIAYNLEVSGFGAVASIALRNCLSVLVSKYTRQKGEHLYVVFLDLKAAFDTVDKDLLWSKLDKMSIEPRLLYLIKILYSGSTCRIRASAEGVLADSIVIN